MSPEVPATEPDGRTPLPCRAATWTAAASLLLPLVVASRWFLFPHVGPKVMVLHLAACVALALVGCTLVLGRLRARPAGPVTLAGAAWIGVAALSAVLGVDPSRSFWDTGERMLGLATLLSAGAWYVALVQGARDGPSWRRLWRTTLAVGIVVTVLAALEADTGGRTTSTLGHPSYLGALGLHLTFAAVLHGGGSPSRADRALAWAGGAAGVAAIVLGESRAAALGLVVGAAAALAWAAAESTPRLRRRWCAGAAAVAVLAATVFLLRDTEPFRSLPFLRRLSDDPTNLFSLRTRLLAWDSAIDAARDRPLLGWGPNTYAQAFAAHFRPELLRFSSRETWFDDAHGVVFNTLAEQGVLGLAALGALHAAAFVALRRARVAGRIGTAAAAAAAGWLAAHLGNLLFAFDDVASLLHVALVLAWCEHVSVPAPAPGPRPATTSFARRAGAGLIVAALLAAAGRTVLFPVAANAHARASLDLVLTDPAAAAERMEASLRLGSPYADSDALVYAWAVRGSLPAQAAAGRAAAADAAARHAFDVLGRTGAAHPREVMRVLLRADLAERTPSLRTDGATTETVRAELQRALTVAPRRQDLHFALASIDVRQGRHADAASLLRKVVADDPLGGEGWSRLAWVYAAAGRPDEARRILDEARGRGVGFSADDEALLATVLTTR